jgi:hypothetical protein
VLKFYFWQYALLLNYFTSSSDACETTAEKSSQNRKKMFSQEALASPSVIHDFDFEEPKVSKKGKKSYETKKQISRIPKKTSNEGSY